jgi:predicted permease
MTPRIPRLAARLLSWRLSRDWYEFVIGDLEEEFASRAARAPRAARWWLWKQTLRCLATPPRSINAVAPLHDWADTYKDSMFRTFGSDIKYAFRVLFRAPSFAFAVVAVLALGIGANTAIFSIVNAVLLRPLPFDDPATIVRLFHVPPQNTFPGITRFTLSAANFYDWQRQARTFEGMAMYRFRRFALAEGGSAESILAGAVGAGFFELLHARPALGRTFLPEEDTAGRGRVVVLSDRFWRTRYNGAGDIVGRTIRLDGESYTIVGVMPARFSVGAWGVTARDLWVPMALDEGARNVRENHNHAAVARLKPGVSLQQAQAELEAISVQLERAYPQANTGWGATIVPLQELIVSDIRLSLWMLLAAVALVLLVACANVGNLLFARGLGRRKEIAIRSALGAGRARVFQQLLIEALTLAMVGGVAGVALAHLCLTTGAALLADQIPRADEIAIDTRVLVFAVVVSILTGVLAGALPAIRAGKTDLNEALKEGGRNDSAVGVRTRRALIVCEVALSVVLLMGAALMVRSVVALRHVDAGFDPTNVLTMVVSLPDTRYASPSRVHGFFEAALARLRELPGVRSAGAIDDLPITGDNSVQPIVLEGKAELLPSDQPTVEVRKITPGYLNAMSIRLHRGRDVADTDESVLLVSQSAATLLWGTEDPIGRRITLPLQDKSELKRVVGIVADVKQGDLSGGTAPTVYEYTRDFSWSNLTFVMRTSVPPESLIRPAAEIIRAIDPEQPIEQVRTMEDVLNETLTSQRFSATLLAGFAAVALALSSVGIYSVLSYIVRGRSREIGIRTALGARTSDVLRLVLAEGMTPAAIGIVAGAIAALAASSIMKQLVFGVSATDPLTLVVVSGILAAVALAASLLPALRAARLDPLKVLRGGS